MNKNTPLLKQWVFFKIPPKSANHWNLIKFSVFQAMKDEVSFKRYFPSKF